MRENCKIKTMQYLGIVEPSTLAEIKVEIVGLRHVISQAEEMICRLNQALALVELENEGQNDSNSGETH